MSVCLSIVTHSFLVSSRLQRVQPANSIPLSKIIHRASVQDDDSERLEETTSFTKVGLPLTRVYLRRLHIVISDSPPVESDVPVDNTSAYAWSMAQGERRPRRECEIHHSLGPNGDRMSSKLVVDIHTHIYLPRYVSLLRSRTQVPRILNRLNDAGKEEPRLQILADEPSGGRPIGPQYWDRDEKFRFMDTHGIDVSVVSPANPWLDFLGPSDAAEMSKNINLDLETYCSSSSAAIGKIKRLYAFGLLPLVPSIHPPSILEAISQVASLPHLRGVIMGTKGIGKGLDDENLEPVWEALAREKLVIFLHPHYGVDGQAWGEKANGHVLPLALGFPFETTTATTRLILSGVLDRHPTLRLLIAHSGAALPQLSSRLASCIHHDPVVASRLEHDARYYLGKLWYDAVCYGPEELEFVSRVVERAHKFLGIEQVGSDRIMFGTDHPFFPPLSSTDKWMSVVENLDAIQSVSTWTESQKDGVRGMNAVALFDLGST